MATMKTTTQQQWYDRAENEVLFTVNYGNGDLPITVKEAKEALGSDCKAYSISTIQQVFSR